MAASSSLQAASMRTTMASQAAPQSRCRSSMRVTLLATIGAGARVTIIRTVRLALYTSTFRPVPQDLMGRQLSARMEQLGMVSIISSPLSVS